MVDIIKRILGYFFKNEEKTVVGVKKLSISKKVSIPRKKRKESDIVGEMEKLVLEKKTTKKSPLKVKKIIKKTK